MGLRYTNQRLGFSFEAPDGEEWKITPGPPDSNIVEFVNQEDHSFIQVKVNPAIPQFRTAQGRRKLMDDANTQWVDPAGPFGDEKENIILSHNMGDHAAWLSTVHDGIHYELIWKPYGNAKIEDAAATIARTFTFSSRHPIHNLTQEQKIALEVLSGVSRGEDAGEIAERHGMVGKETSSGNIAYRLPRPTNPPPPSVEVKRGQAPLSLFWVVVAIAAGLYWGISYGSGGISKTFATYMPVLLSFIVGVIATGTRNSSAYRPSKNKGQLVIRAAWTCWMIFAFAFFGGLMLVKQHVIAFGYSHH